MDYRIDSRLEAILTLDPEFYALFLETFFTSGRTVVDTRDYLCKLLAVLHLEKKND